MGHYREILPSMVSISNNSRLTNEVSIAIAEKLSPEEFHKFKEWMKLVEQHSQIEKNNAVKKFRHF
jgi:hypothetical protein